MSVVIAAARHPQGRRAASSSAETRVARRHVNIEAKQSGRTPHDLLSPAALASPEFSAMFARSFSLAAFIVNRHLVDHFMRVSRELDLDYEALVIWAVLAHQNAVHAMPRGSGPGAVLDERGRLSETHRPHLRPLRLRDISQITGIPRETVRRKLVRLRDAHWIAESDEGWVVSAERIEELRPLTEETVRRFLATAGELVQTLQRAGEQR